MKTKPESTTKPNNESKSNITAKPNNETTSNITAKPNNEAASNITAIPNNEATSNITTKPKDVLTIVLFLVYLLLLTSIILFKLPFRSDWTERIRVLNLIPFAGAHGGKNTVVVREMLNNVLLFIPFGIYMVLLMRQRTFVAKVLPVIGATFFYEIMQYLFAIGRSDITDILDNTIGGLLGIALAMLLFVLMGDKAKTFMKVCALVVTILVAVRFTQLFYLSHFVMRMPEITRLPVIQATITDIRRNA